MNSIVPFSKFSKRGSTFPFLSNTSIVTDKEGVPLGFVFGRDSFISLLEKIDDEFEKNAKNPQKAYNNLAGKLIDIIEEKLPIKPEFASKLKSSISRSQKQNWIPLKEVIKALHV